MDNLSKIMKITKNMSLLYAEDEEVLGNTTNIIFETIFKKSLLVDNGQKALDAFNANTYDIVITDVHMPVMDGYELAMKLKEISEDLPILITSAFINDKMAEKFKTKGIYYLKKPFDLEKLVSTLDEMLNKCE